MFDGFPAIYFLHQPPILVKREAPRREAPRRLQILGCSGCRSLSLWSSLVHSLIWRRNSVRSIGYRLFKLSNSSIRLLIFGYQLKLQRRLLRFQALNCSSELCRRFLTFVYTRCGEFPYSKLLPQFLL